VPGSPGWKQNRPKLVEVLGEEAVQRYERFRLGPAAASKEAGEAYLKLREALARLIPETELERIRKLFAGYDVYASGSATQPGKPFWRAVNDLDVFVVVPEGTPPDLRQAIEARARDVRIRPDPEFLRNNRLPPDHTIGLDAKAIGNDEFFGLATTQATGRTPLNYAKVEGALPPANVNTKGERVKLFTKELGGRPPAKSHDEAYKQLADSMNKVKDAESGMPFHPERWATDGRLYPPQEDRRLPIPDRPDIAGYRSLGHTTYIGDNGAIEIQTAVPKGQEGKGKVIFSKQGADGRGVWEK
jgi:hypothetical protein